MTQQLLLQNQYDRIYEYFKTTTEQFDFLGWDGKILNVWDNFCITEIYKYRELKSLGIF